MMNLSYWALEYAKVLFAYGFIMFVWPSAVFYPHLRGKSLTYRFGFCATVPVVLYTTVITMLGNLHILSTWMTLILFYGAFILAIVNILFRYHSTMRIMSNMSRGTLGVRQFALLSRIRIRAGFKKRFRRLKERGAILDYLFLILLVVYGMIYFSYGNFQQTSYGFGDLYTHHSWIDGLMNGVSFSGGIYPASLHCIIYTMRVSMNISVFSSLLFLAPIHIAIYIVSAYVMFRNIFKWQFTPHFILLLFLVLNLVSAANVTSMARLQWTLPQDYGLYNEFIASAFLIRYLKQRDRKWTEDLLIICMSVAAVIAIHFYSAIMAALLCFCFALVRIKDCFGRHFWPLVLSVMAGFMLAVVPMAVAFIEGVPLQNSLNWALSIIDGTDSESRVRHEETVSEAEQMNEAIYNALYGSDTDSVPDAMVQDGGMGSGELAQGGLPASLMNKLEPYIRKIQDFGQRAIHSIYQDGYVTLYAERAMILLISVALNLAVLLCVGLCRLLHRKKEGEVEANALAPSYLDLFALVFASVLFMFIYAAPLMGLPEIVSGVRLGTSINMLQLAMFMGLVDYVFVLLMHVTSKPVLRGLSVMGAVGACAAIILTGNYHGYMYKELTRYNAAVNVTNSIVESLPEQSFTIVSTTDELYRAIEKGFHEEIITLIQAQGKDEGYWIPTKYLFVYVEKQPISYAQYHYSKGPAWLANTNYYPGGDSEYPEIIHGEIDETTSSLELPDIENPWHHYKILELRTIWEAKLMDWVKVFTERYPDAIKIYYEDETFVCYCITQSPECPYNLVVMQ